MTSAIGDGMAIIVLIAPAPPRRRKRAPAGKPR
jgi:hypothetical protein